MLRGCATEKLRRRGDGDGSCGDACFSLVTLHRTLDLEVLLPSGASADVAAARAMRDRWAAALDEAVRACGACASAVRGVLVARRNGAGVGAGGDG